MTDTTTEAPAAADTPEQGWGEDSAVSYPEMPSNPHNHIYTVSMDGRGPMIVVRGNTPQEVSERYQALMDGGVTTIAASVYSHMKAEMAVASGVGPVSPVPGPPAAPGAPVPPPFGPNVSVPQAPGFQGNPGFPAPPTPPAQGQWGGQQQGPRDNTPEFQQNGWYALTVPFPVGKKQFDGICAQYQLKKGRPAEGGSFSFNGTNKTWYVAPAVAGVFPMFNPVPA